MRHFLPLLLALLAVTPAAAAPPDLLAALRGGGLVIFLRHAETGPPHPDQARAVIGECATQRLLNEEGREQARGIGAAIAEFGIPLAEVLASPFCRTMETAVLAFGRAVPEPALSLPRHVDDAARLAMGRDLLALVARTPPAAGNLVLVGHSYHLIGAGLPRPDPQGAAVILRRDGAGGLAPLAVLPPAAWFALVHRTAAARR